VHRGAPLEYQFLNLGTKYELQVDILVALYSELGSTFWTERLRSIAHAEARRLGGSEADAEEALAHLQEREYLDVTSGSERAGLTALGLSVVRQLRPRS